MVERVRSPATRGVKAKLLQEIADEDAKDRIENDQRQVGGDHYRKHGNLQPFNIIDHYGLDFYGGNAIKYLLRFTDTMNIRDLEKARHYIERMIDRAEVNESE